MGSVHQSLYKCKAKVIRKGRHVMATAPRHVLDFIQNSLAVKSTELETKNKEAEKQMQQSIEIIQLGDKQTKEIPIRKAEVGKDLGRVEPSVIDAQNAGKSNKKQHLVEGRSTAIPPPLTKMARENRESAPRFANPLMVLKAEQPDIDQKRSVLLKLKVGGSSCSSGTARRTCSPASMRPRAGYSTTISGG